MKILVHLSSFESLSRNALNISEWDRFANNYKDDLILFSWVAKQFRTWAINEGPSTRVENLAPDAPAWARQAHQRGDDLILLDYDALANILAPIIDYFRHITLDGGKYSNISVPDAIKQEKEWHLKLATAKKSILEEDGVSTIKTYDNGYSWVKVYGRKSLKREGEQMGHCVGDYCEEVKAGNKTIYSLRDSKNIPHVTVEVNAQNNVVQIKGTANESVASKYKEYCIDFLGFNSFNFIDLDGLDVNFSKILDRAKKYKTYKDAKNEDVNISGKGVLSINEPHKPFTYGQISMAELKVGGKTVQYFNKGKFSTLDKKSKIVTFDNAEKVPHFEESTHKDLIFESWKYLCSSKRLGFTFDISPIVGSASRFFLPFQEFALSSSIKEQIGGITINHLPHRMGWAWPAFKKISNIDTVLTTKRGSLLAGAHASSSAVEIIIVANAADTIPDLKKWVGKRKVYFNGASTANLLVQRAFTEDTRNGEKAGKSLKLSNLPKDLKNALEVFTEVDEYAYIVAHLDKASSVSEVSSIYKHHKIATSGFLYKYFPSFIFLILSKNKKLVLEVLNSKRSIMRQFLAFSVLPSSIESGAWYRHDTGGIDIDKALAKIRKYMPSLVPLTEKQLEGLDLKDVWKKKLRALYGIK